MSGQATNPPGSGTVTQDSLFVAAIERIGRFRDGRIAVQIHLSRMKSQNRQEGYLRIAFRMLEPMINAYRGQVFLMHDSELIMLLKDPNMTDVENMVYRLRALFSKDPVAYGADKEGADQFCTFYNLETADYQKILGYALASEKQAKRSATDRRSATALPPALTAANMSFVTETLKNSKMQDLINRQSAIQILPDRRRAEIIFQEFFISMSALKKATGDEFNLLGNRWLFQHLSLTLDQLMLDTLSVHEFKVLPSTFSLNLNLASIMTDNFSRFEAAVAGKAKIAVELQILDLLADSGAYFTVRSLLRANGHTIIIDGFDALTMKFMDASQFGADYYKVSWSPEMRDSDLAILGDAGIGGDKLILTRCDSEIAIFWGLDHSISRFQGHYVDTVLAGFARAQNRKTMGYSLLDHIKGRSVISGPAYEACGGTDRMDIPITLNTARGRAKEGKAS